MARFFFNLRNTVNVEDEEGLDLPDLTSARDLAVRQARVMIAAAATEEGAIDLDHHIEIADRSGTVLGVIFYRDAVSFTKSGQPVAA